MKAKRSNYGGVIALLLIGAAGVYAVGVYVGKTPDAQVVPPAARRITPDEKGSEPAEKITPSETASATVLTPKSENGNLTFESATETIPDGTNKIVFAVNRYLENSHITPPSAKALSVDVREGIAYISFTEAMDKTYGSSDEQTLVQGLCKTLAQFPEVKKVLFEVSGKAIETFGGVDLTQPIDVRDQDEQSTKPEA